MHPSLAALLLLATVWAQPNPIPSSSSTFYSEMAAMELLVCDLLRHHPVYHSLSLQTDCGYNIAKFGTDLCAVVFYFEDSMFLYFYPPKFILKKLIMSAKKAL